MLIEERKKGFIIMQSFWAMAVAITCAYIFEEEGTFLLVFMLIIGVQQLIGSFVYLGYTGLLAGFNTMAPDEIGKYNMKKISSFIGISFVLMAFITFLISFLILITVSDKEAFAVLFILFFSSTLFCAFYSSTKRFKK